jgi:8-oxo-dGTP pyrophosphatase MutT (NUDIX family)
MIQRKYTPEYIELVRGRYYYNDHTINYQYLTCLITYISQIERNYVERHEFDYLWKHIWQWVGTPEQMHLIYDEHDECQRRFNLLKTGHLFDKHGYLSFQSLFNNYPTTTLEPDWEFPKGKRNEGECEQQVAIRESREETSLDSGDFNLLYHVKPFQERFMGVNGINYCNNYYLAQLTNQDHLIYYDPDHIEQNKEIRNIGWFTIHEIDQLVNPQCAYRLKMIHDVDHLVTNLSTI